MPLVLICGALANKPGNGGNAWSRLSWVQGFRQMGFDVLFAEQIRRDHCVDASGRPAPFDSSFNARYFQETMAQYGMTRSAGLICEEDSQTCGLPLQQLEALAPQIDILFNIGGHLTHEAIVSRAQCRLYYDDDPGYTQIWATEDARAAGLDGHDYHYTIGANIGGPECSIPTAGYTWRHTWPPVVLDDWPACFGTGLDVLSTVASWRGAYGRVVHNGQTYGQKAHEFRKFIEIPQRTGRMFEIALQIHEADLKDRLMLTDHGWRLVDPLAAASTPDRFRSFVQHSSAEFSVAQGIYVETHSGWFSDRTVRYLASGKPALVQETGFSRHVPTGTGLLKFGDMAEATAAVQEIAGNYPRHARAARQIAEDHFSSTVVIGRLLNEIGIQAPLKRTDNAP